MPSRVLPREQSYADVEHPDLIHGRSVVRLGSNLHELADRIKNGDATQGWEGDPRLTLAKAGTGRDERYELWRLEADGQYRLVAKLPALRDPSGIIAQLVRTDARRGYDIKAAVDRHNAKVQAEAERPGDERMLAGAEKLAWALRRDIG